MAAICFCADLVRERQGFAAQLRGDYRGRIPLRDRARSFMRRANSGRRVTSSMAPEDFVLITAQPGCDLDWLEALDDEKVRALDDTETLSLLEERLIAGVAVVRPSACLPFSRPIMRTDAAGLFGQEDSVRISCPRCGALHIVGHENLSKLTWPRRPAPSCTISAQESGRTRSPSPAD